MPTNHDLDRDVIISTKGEKYHRIVGDGKAHCNGHYGADHETEVITEREALKLTDGPCNACVWPCQEEHDPPKELPEEAYLTSTPRCCRYYHTSTDCGRLQSQYDEDEEPREATLPEIQYHELTRCPQCPDNRYEPPELPVATDGGVERCGEQVLGLPCEREDGHDGPCSRQERKHESRVGQ